LATFYETVVNFGGNLLRPEQLKEAMSTLADTSVAGREDRRVFLTLLWTPEFFVARREAFV
jgi:hypothetical protein